MVFFLKIVLIYVSISFELSFKFNYYIYVCVENYLFKIIEILIKWYYDGIYVYSFFFLKFGKGRFINRLYIFLFLIKILLSEERN